MNNKTTVIKTHTPKWHFIDANGQTLGRLASKISKILSGKNSAEFSYRTNSGDKVVITNASKIEITGNKEDTKVYYWHTGFPGGIKNETLGDRMRRKPEEVLRKSISGMLPKNKLRRIRLNNLYIYKDAEHPHKGQEK